jgi:hypothetical protein
MTIGAISRLDYGSDFDKQARPTNIRRAEGCPFSQATKQPTPEIVFRKTNLAELSAVAPVIGSRYSNMSLKYPG